MLYRPQTVSWLWSSFSKIQKVFNGEQVLELAPEPLSREEIYEKVHDIKTQFGKKVPSIEDTNADKSKGKGKGKNKGKGKGKSKVKDKGNEKDKNQMQTQTQRQVWR